MQDIQFALAYQKPLRLTLSPFGERLYLLWQHTSSQKDRDWTHKAIWLLAETINHCYGVNPSLEMEVVGWSTLKRRIHAWDLEKPDSFRPLHYSAADPRVGRPFPVVWFTKSLHGMSKTLGNIDDLAVDVPSSDRSTAYLYGQSLDPATGTQGPLFDA